MVVIDPPVSFPVTFIMSALSIIKNNFLQCSVPALSLPCGTVAYNRNRVNGGYPVGTRADFSCNYGYSRSGPRSRTCQTSGNWNQQTPTCNRSNKITYFIH